MADAIRTAGGEALAVPCDVRDRVAVERAAEQVAAHFGVASILVNAAGGNAPEATTSADRSFFALDPRAIVDVVRLNFTGTVICCQVFGRGMAERSAGCIVNVASMNALRPLTRIPA